MKRSSLNLFIFFVLFAFSFNTTAKNKIEISSPDNGIVKDFQKNFKDAADKLISLAEAIPEKDYSWRPGKGVRSVSEALVHVSVGNLFIPKYIGFNTKEKISFSMEKEITKKADVIALLKKSLKFVKDSFDKIDEDQLGVEVDFFNKQKSTKRGVMLLIISHNHEHLGQMIAYARSVGVVPPWSQKKK